MTLLLLLLQPDALHPARFGSPGGVGETRGWYYWRGFDGATAEVERESDGRRFRVKVLPWGTSYRHLAYPGFHDELLPGERVNLFFAAENGDPRAWLVHVQDEIGQMKGHGKIWRVEGATLSGFRADGLDFVFAPGVGKALAAGDGVYLRWCRDGERRIVHTVVDEAGLPALKAAAEKRVAGRIAREGMGATAEEGRILVDPGFWSQARAIRGVVRIDGRDVRVLSAKNLGTYGSGATELKVGDVGLRGRIRVYLP